MFWTFHSKIQLCFNYLQTVAFHRQTKESSYIYLTAFNKYSFRMVSHKQTQFFCIRQFKSDTLGSFVINYFISVLHLIYYYLFLIITTEVKIHFNITPYLQLGLPNGLLRSGSPTNTPYRHLFSIFLYVPYILPISFFFTSSPE